MTATAFMNARAILNSACHFICSFVCVSVRHTVTRWLVFCQNGYRQHSFTSVRQVSSGYVNFVASGVHLTPCRLQHSSTLSCRPVSTTATRFSSGRRRLGLLQTDCNECWTLRHVLSGRKFDRGLSPVTDYAYRASLAGRSWTNQLKTRYAHVPMPAQQSSSVPDGPLHISIRRCLSSINGYALPVVIKSLFHGTGSVPMDVGHLPLLARLSGTHFPRTCVIRMFLRTVTGSH